MSGGVKYTLTSQFEIMWIKEEIGRDFVVYSGADEMAMAGLSFGADGIIKKLGVTGIPFLDKL